ncbi:MAG: NADH-quinone oxidoreductase subunit N [Planctomycetota bacterium]
MDWSELSQLLPVGVVLVAALVVVAIDLFLKPSDRFVLPWVGIAGCGIALVLALKMNAAAWFAGSQDGGAKTLILGGAFAIDGFGLGIWVVACLAGALSLLSAAHHEEESTLSTGEFLGLILLAVAGMMFLAVSHDFLTLLISLEIMSISTYILTGSNRHELRSNEGAMKYLVLGAFSTAFMLMGIAFFYGGTGSFSLNEIVQVKMGQAAQFKISPPFVLLGMGLIFVGALFKIGAAPFHFWIPDVYQGAPVSVTGLMSVGVKAAAFAVVCRLFFETFSASEYSALWLPAVEVIAVATMVVGNILAMTQNSVKRMLAYSGIAHTGYLMLGLLIAPNSKDVAEHLHSINFYLLVYGVMTLGAFGVLGLLRKDGRPIETMSDFGGLAKEHTGIALCMAIFMLSLAGMPPLGGAFSKFMIFKGAIKEGHVMAAVLGILTSVASLYYYLRVVVSMFMAPSNDDVKGEEATSCQYSWGTNLLIYATGIITLILGLVPGLVF